MTDLINNSSISETDIILIFNDFYNTYLNGFKFEYLIDLYIKKNIKIIFDTDLDFILSENELNYDMDKFNKYKIEFNDKYFTYLYIKCDKEYKDNKYIKLFISYLSIFYYNNFYSKPIDIVKCNLFIDVLNMINDGVLILNENLDILFLNKVWYIILDKIYDYKIYINKNIYDIFSQLDEYIKPLDIYKNKKINYKINRNNTDFNMVLTVNTIIHNNIQYNIITICLSNNENKTCDNIGFLSHELRNPLQTISFASELIKIKKDNKYLDIIDKSVGDMIKIINDILDIDRINSNQIQLNIQNTLLDDILNDIEFSIPKNKNIQFKITKFKNIGYLYTDSTRLKQILLNIINNSIKYSKPNSINNIELKINHNNDNNSVEFYICDNGIGIKKEKISELMELKPSISHNKNNSNGIGLYLCNKLAIMLGGNIKINSEYMNFTEIIFTHPLNLTYNDNIINKKIENFRIFNKILIVDSDITLLNLFKDILMNLKIKYNLPNNLLIDLCDNVNIVCDLVKLNNYDIIFMDLYMNDINGTTIAKLLRKQYYNNKIVGMTVNPDDIFCNDSLTTSINEKNLNEEKRKIIQLYDDIILKPFNENDILDKIKY